MINLTRKILEQYYGFNNESINDDRSLSIHRCVNDTNNSEKKNIDEHIILNEHEEIVTKEDMQNDADNDRKESAGLHIHNFCTLDTKVENNKNTISESCTSLESSFFNNALDNNIFVDIIPYEDNTKVSHPLSVPEEPCTSELCPMSADDCLDTVSDISSVIVQEESSRSSKNYTDLPPIPNKVPIYNSMFVDLSNAQLIAIPDNILQQFSGIRMLYLENNTLSEIPDELFPSLQNLEWLDVRNNQLQCLPKNIKSHPSLHTLLLQGNRLQVLPFELCFVPKLKNLQVANNPLIMPPESVISLGCTNILNFLKVEWNKLHPNEIIIPVKEEKPKSLTVLSNESFNRKKQNISHINHCHSYNDIPNKCSKTSVARKKKVYKPSNGCDSKGINVDKQNQLLWINEITDLLNKEASALQKLKDKMALQGWRDDKSSFHKSMNKAAKRGEGDIPFAIDTLDDLSMSKGENKLERKKSILVPPGNINNEIIRLFDSLDEINRDDDCNSMSPTSKQKFLSEKIKKVCIVQNEIRNLQRYNDISTIL